MFETHEGPVRALLVAVQLPDVDDVAFRSSVTELGRLARTLGVEVAGQLTQRRGSLHPGTVIGKGKLVELQRLVGFAAADGVDGQEDAEENAGAEEYADDDAGAVADEPEDADEGSDPDEGSDAPAGDPRTPLASASPRAHESDGDEAAARPAGAPATAPAAVQAILVDHDLTPSQARNLEKLTGLEVLDRTAVILEIFRRHSRSRAAKAQVEIVRLQYLVPRLREQGKGGDRQRGGIGGKGAGESSLELDKRKIRDRIAELGREIEAMAEEQRTQRARRRDMSRVALCGYTNAGKSTLMRTLTGSEVYVADKLFATLDTTVRVLVPPVRPRILVSDTVGFIDKLPHGLVASFKSTLDEALEAGLIAHVVDASDPAFERQLQVTAELLDEIGARDVPRLLIFNKIDRVGGEGAEEATRASLSARWPEAVIMSAHRPADVAGFRDRLIAFFARDLVEGDVLVPYDRQNLRGEIFASCDVLGESYEEGGVRFHVRAHPSFLSHVDRAARLAGDRGQDHEHDQQGDASSAERPDLPDREPA